MTKEELIREVNHWRKEARESQKIQVQLEAKISELTTGYEFRLTEYEAKIEAAKPLLEAWCKECGEAEFEHICENDCCVYKLKALLIPRKEDSGTLEEHLANLRKRSPAKCQDCECLHSENHGSSHADYVYVCETSPKCYKENTTP